MGCASNSYYIYGRLPAPRRPRSTPHPPANLSTASILLSGYGIYLHALWQHWPLIKLLSYFQYYVSINYIKQLQEAVLLHNASWQTLLKEKNMYAKPRRNYLPANLSLSFATEPIWLGLHIFCKKIINRRTYSDAHFIKKNATCEKTNHHRHHQESSWYGSILSMDPA